MEKIKGVNLGNWLVLEKWMSPNLFRDTTAGDEYYLPTQLPKDVYEARITQHREEYITERDFVTIRAIGLDTVRIPVPYFIFGDREPFIGCIKELDKAFAWAEKYGLRILIDLHTAPDSQNGFDNGGISGVCKFFSEPEEIEFVYTVLERLAERYGKRKGLFGIEILNEPISQMLWERMNISARYPAVDPEKAAGSKGYDPEELRKFYLTAYERIMKHLPEDKKVVFHDGFDLKAWKDFMQEPKFANVVLDTHQYLMMADAMGNRLTVEDYKKVIEGWGNDIAEMQQYFPVVTGEWCLSNAAVEGQPYTDEEKKEIYNTLDHAQKEAWDRGNGYFYWSYKLHVDAAADPSAEGRAAWDLGRSVDMGWFKREI